VTKIPLQLRKIRRRQRPSDHPDEIGRRSDGDWPPSRNPCKALRGLEVGATGFDPKVSLDDPEALTKFAAS
jgi:hypothetical protein